MAGLAYEFIYVIAALVRVSVLSGTDISVLFTDISGQGTDVSGWSTDFSCTDNRSTDISEFWAPTLVALSVVALKSVALTSSL